MSTSRRAELYLLAITVVWGSTFVVTKDLIVENSAFFYTALRFLLAAILLFIPARARVLSATAASWKHGTVLGTLLFIGFVLQTVGLAYTTASKAAFFTGMLVPFTPIVHFAGQRLFGLAHRPLRFGNLLGVLMAAGAIALLLLRPALRRWEPAAPAGEDTVSHPAEVREEAVRA